MPGTLRDSIKMHKQTAVHWTLDQGTICNAKSAFAKIPNRIGKVRNPQSKKN